jgi:hypothetical protein
MLVKTSSDNGSTFGAPADTRDIFGDDEAERIEAEAALIQIGRYWTGGGAAPLILVMRAA